MSKSTVPVLWAQRKDKILITLDVPDIDQNTFKAVITGEQHFHAEGSASGKSFTVDLDLDRPVSSEGLLFKIHGKQTNIIIPRKEPGEHWNRLLADTGKKFPWLKVNWQLWVDEEQEGKSRIPGWDENDFDPSSFGGAPPGAGFDEDDEGDEEDDDDEDEVGGEDDNMTPNIDDMKADSMRNNVQEIETTLEEASK